MFIYKISNTINDKVYIGQSIRPVEERFKRHITDAINNKLDTHFARAIRKYGENAFYIEIIDTANSQEELNLKEQYWIKYYDSILNGYNETDATYKCGGNTYQSKSEEELSNIKEKISITKIGSPNPNSHAIKCFNVKTNEELHFATCEECRIYFNEKHHRFISTRVDFKTKSLYKGLWKIGYENEPYHNFQQKINKRGIQILVESDDGFNCIFESIRLVERKLNINRKRIADHVKNKEQIFNIDNYKFTILN